MPVDPSQRDIVLAAIKAEYGDATIRKPGSHDVLERISTGDPMLDWAIGGGVPVGRVNHFYGGYGSAKTLACWNIARNAQKMDKGVVYYNPEKQFDEIWAKKWGINTDELLVVEGTVIEEIGEQMESLLGAYHVHIVDSVAATVSQDELSGDVGDWLPGIGARAWGKVMRRVNNRFDPRDNMIILVNHVSTPFGRGGEEPKGAKFLEYMSSLSLHFRRSSWLFHNKDGILTDAGTGDSTLTGDKEPDGIEFQVRAAKTRVSIPNRTARLRLDYSTGTFDELWALSRAAIHFKLVERSGSWYSWEGHKRQGDPGVRRLLEEFPEFREQVEARLVE